MSKTRKVKNKRWKAWHKWLALCCTVFVLILSLSGIVLNHRKALSGVDLSRSLMPETYHYSNWNNSTVRGTVLISEDSVAIYGGGGIHLVHPDDCSVSFDFNKGIPEVAENRRIDRLVHTDSGELFAQSTYKLYKYDKTTQEWIDQRPLWEANTELPHDERLSDLEARGDSLIFLTRSHAFLALPPYDLVKKMPLVNPDGFESKVTLFKVFWKLHSGELFGFPGQLFVDFLGLITIFLCCSGLIIWCFPKLIKRRRKRLQKTQNQGLKKQFVFYFKWHNKLGKWLMPFLLILGITGACLRPPLMIPLVITKLTPPKGTTMSHRSAWHDNLRTIRYDEMKKEWFIYSSHGGYTFKHWGDAPKKVSTMPPVSPMGITSMTAIPEDSLWVVTSFRGAYTWDRFTHEIIDCVTDKPYVRKRGVGRPIGKVTVSGYSHDLGDHPVFLSSSKGPFLQGKPEEVAPWVTMPVSLNIGRISLWHFALEAHTGRLFEFLLGPVRLLYVFLMGSFFVVIILSGWVLRKKRL